VGDIVVPSAAASDGFIVGRYWRDVFVALVLSWRHGGRLLPSMRAGLSTGRQDIQTSDLEGDL
jgi:hypothetical protein